MCSLLPNYHHHEENGKEKKCMHDDEEGKQKFPFLYAYEYIHVHSFFTLDQEQHPKQSYGGWISYKKV